MHRTKRRPCIIARDSNIVRIDFNQDPDPPAPRFPGAAGLREHRSEPTADTDIAVAPACLAG
jgi:hypothetical protein